MCVCVSEYFDSVGSFFLCWHVGNVMTIPIRSWFMDGGYWIGLDAFGISMFYDFILFLLFGSIKLLTH